MAYIVGGESSSGSDTLNSTPKWKYHVFLSFAGKDTRLNFAGHLYEAFEGKGMKTFRDDVDLERGQDIKQNLFQAIQDSLCAVLIISENYVNSTWCLEELQKILESRNTLDLRVFPIFYDVNPADVRHQRKRFRENLAKHEEKFKENTTKVQNWRNALFEISNLSGWDTRGKHEADLIKNIVGVVWTYLSSKLPSDYDHLVGIDSRVGDMMPLLEIGSNDKRFVGIWGMGGVGKTTLARVVFEKISDEFEVFCFLEKVRETLLERDGLVSLQKRLLSNVGMKDVEISDVSRGMKMIKNHLCNRKVLLVLDDVDHMNQLENLAGSLDWFGEGSRIIITTRDSHLLTVSRVEKIYEMETMKNDESLQLFSNKAFNGSDPEKDYLELSKSVVKYAGGLPLALKALGSFLCGRSKAQWIDTLDRLKKIPDDDIFGVLKISYDGLNKDQKTIFLDIVCFFKGCGKKEVTQILKACDLNPIIGIEVLIEKTLLFETEDCTLDMHDLYDELGRYIIHQESPKSRLWKFEDIKKALEDNKGYEAIEAIGMRDYRWELDYKMQVHPEAFSKMSNIRLLIFDTSCQFILPKGLKSFGAKSVQWPFFPLEALPLQLNELVYIEMQSSQIKQLGNGTQSMNNLEFVDLSCSPNFIETPDFSSVQSLKYLHLRECNSLVEVHHSLGELKQLVEVDLRRCVNLIILPRRLETNSLRKLDLHGCKQVTELPEFEEGMTELSYLDVSGTAITALPESLGSLTGLRELYLSRTDHLVNIPAGCFSSLFELVFLSLEFCKRLESVPRLPPRLIRLEALGCNSMIGSLDEQLWNLVASVGHECRGRTKYVISEDDFELFQSMGNKLYSVSRFLKSENIKPECLPLRNFFAIMPSGDRVIPSWFDPNIKYYGLFKNIFECVIEVGVPLNFRGSKWSGIVVCLGIAGFVGSIRWSSKAPEDDNYNIWWPHYANSWLYNYGMCIMVLEFNEETCWQHLRGDNNSLHIKLTVDVDPYDWLEMWGCGLRVICKEEIEEWCHLNHFSQPHPTPPDDEVKLSATALVRVLGLSHE